MWLSWPSTLSPSAIEDSKPCAQSEKTQESSQVLGTTAVSSSTPPATTSNTASQMGKINTLIWVQKIAMK
jgi:hypothetical protein